MNGLPNFNGFYHNMGSNNFPTGFPFPNNAPNMFFADNPHANFNFFIGGDSTSSTAPSPSAQATSAREYLGAFQAGNSLMTQGIDATARSLGVQGNPTWTGQSNMTNLDFNGLMGRVATSDHVPNQQQGMLDPGQRNREHVVFVVSPDGQQRCIRTTTLTQQQQQAETGNFPAIEQFSPSHQTNLPGPGEPTGNTSMNRSASNTSSPVSFSNPGLISLSDITNIQPLSDGRQEFIIERSAY